MAASSYAKWTRAHAKARLKSAQQSERMTLRAIVLNLANWSSSTRRQGFTTSDLKGQVTRDIERLVDAYTAARDDRKLREHELAEVKKRK